MYRRHQRMEAELKQECQFIQRVGSIPVVTSAVEQVSEVYSKTKEFSPIFKYPMEMAENVVKFGAETAKPLVNKFEKPIAVVNDFACGQLTKLESNYPIITKQPAEIVQSSKNVIQEVKTYGVNKVNNVKQYGQDKVSNMKNYGYDKAVYVMESEVGKEVINRFDDIVTYAEKLIDNFLPPDCDGKEVSMNEVPNNSVKRLVVLSDKAYQRVRCRALQQVEKLRNTALEKVEELKDLLILMKDKTISSAKTCNDKVLNVLRELTKEEEIQAQNWQEKLLQKARVLTKSLVHIFKQASNFMSYFSSLTKQRFLEAKDLAENLYTTFKMVSGTGEISDAVISYSQETLQNLQDILITLGNLLPGLNKFVPSTINSNTHNDMLNNDVTTSDKQHHH